MNLRKIVKLIFILFCFTVMLCGCSKSVTVASIDETETVETVTDLVSLDDIEPPEFGKRFAILYDDSGAINICWGACDNEVSDGFFRQDSGYPGFGYPVVIQKNYYDPSDCITITTLYGKYEYSYDCAHEAFEEDGYLYKREANNAVINTNVPEECLFIYDSAKANIYEYKYEKGTKIIVN